MRSRRDNAEFLISLDSEYGVSGGQTALPSYVIYPGERDANKPAWADGVVVSECVQSDEGGRFYRHESVYQLIHITDEIEIADYQYWVSTHTLKQLLKTSNIVSFQLRCIASLVVDVLNPSAFRAKGHSI